jgi:hypothetical protein
MLNNGTGGAFDAPMHYIINIAITTVIMFIIITLNYNIMNFVKFFFDVVSVSICTFYRPYDYQ